MPQINAGQDVNSSSNVYGFNSWPFHLHIVTMVSHSNVPLHLWATCYVWYNTI